MVQYQGYKEALHMVPKTIDNYIDSKYFFFLCSRPRLVENVIKNFFGNQKYFKKHTGTLNIIVAEKISLLVSKRAMNSLIKPIS